MATRAGLQAPVGSPVPLEEVPRLSMRELRDSIVSQTLAGDRLSALFAIAQASASPARHQLLAVLASGEEGRVSLLSADLEESYPALTPDCPQAHLFERKLAEEWGVRPEGHPALPRAEGELFRVDGDEVHEVAVGPVHAGVIEPGHFRFQCHGERVLHLEIALGYQHRGVEAALVGGPGPRTLHYMETLAGDTTIGHATAYAELIEALAGHGAPARAQALRGVSLELERLANHTGDLGALAGDIGYLPAASFCGRIRGDYLNLMAAICGSRFGRGMVLPGGVRFNLDPVRIDAICERLEAATRDVANATSLLWNTSSVLARLENTGSITRRDCEELGLVGVAARACGLERDAREEFPSGIFRVSQIPVSTWRSGDVFARSYVRWLEIQRSALFVREQLCSLPGGSIRNDVKDLLPGRACVSIVEGWRGEICHVAVTDDQGRFAAYKVVDPSFHNWMGLAIAMRDQQISDFPLCNKSFNLSYCGHDL